MRNLNRIPTQESQLEPNPVAGPGHEPNRILIRFPARVLEQDPIRILGPQNEPDLSVWFGIESKLDLFQTRAHLNSTGSLTLWAAMDK